MEAVKPMQVSSPGQMKRGVILDGGAKFFKLAQYIALWTDKYLDGNPIVEEASKSLSNTVFAFNWFKIDALAAKLFVGYANAGDRLSKAEGLSGKITVLPKAIACDVASPTSSALSLTYATLKRVATPVIQGHLPVLLGCGALAELFAAMGTLSESGISIKLVRGVAQLAVATLVLGGLYCGVIYATALLAGNTFVFALGLYESGLPDFYSYLNNIAYYFTESLPSK